MKVNVGFNAIATAANTIVNVSFLVSTCFPLGLFYTIATYLRVATQNRVQNWSNWAKIDKQANKLKYYSEEVLTESTLTVCIFRRN